MLDECDESDPNDISSDSDEKCIPKVVVSEAEDILEVNRKESNMASENSDGHDNEDLFIAKSGRKRLNVANVTISPGRTYAINAATKVFYISFDYQIDDTIRTFTNAEASWVVQNFNANALRIK